MRFSEAWLREWVNPKITTEQLADQLSMAGLEVDSVEPAAPPFTGVVVGEVVTREQLLDDVWGYDTIPFTRTVDTHITKLRKKVEDDPSDPQHVITVHRLGYKFVG